MSPTVILSVVSGVSFVLGGTLFWLTTLKRRRLDAALAQAAAAHARLKPLAVPERIPTYDQDYLIKFIADARSQTIEGENALDYYDRTILAWDMWFAAAFAVFIAAANLLAADRFAAHPFGARTFLILAFVGALYGVADLAEDVMLRKIFRNAGKLAAMKTSPRTAAPAAEDATGNEAARRESLAADAAQSDAANALTRLKVATLGVSVIGGIATAAILLLLDCLK